MIQEEGSKKRLHLMKETVWKTSKPMHSCKTTNSLGSKTHCGTAHMTGVMRWMVTGSTRRTDREGDRDSFYTKEQPESVKLC